MTISVVINTSALGPKAGVITGSRSPTPHSYRAYALRHFIIPIYVAAFDEVIVVGEWETGEDYTYIPCPSVHFNCIDALQQRHLGFKASRGRLVLFQHDDHILRFTEPLAGLLADADVVSPARYVRRTGWWERINGGESRHINGHAALYRREVIESCPWDCVPQVHTWDEAHTTQIQAAGFRVHWSDTMRVADVEIGAEPWR